MTAFPEVLSSTESATDGSGAFQNGLQRDATVLRDAPMLSIVIPALNEEESIGSTVERCLAAREHIQRDGRVRDLEVIVVSDGSTDRTAEIAHEIAEREPGVSVIVFEKNRGYGAALKEGFRQSAGELVSFLDADGTCDPHYFAEMCRDIQDEEAALVLGSRMGPNSEMPRIRRLGNRIYAFVLGVISGQAVTDTASGMRVIRRSALPELYPLPDGLHFTPAMSARAMMNDLRIVEIPMQYSERVGQSKLNVLKDGMRFFGAIADALLLYRPGRLFGLLAVICGLVAVGWGLFPLEFYARNGRLEEWMIYRVLLCGFLMGCCFMLISTGALADEMLMLVHRRRSRTFLNQLVQYLLSARQLCWIAAAAAIAAVVLVSPGLIEYGQTGHTSLHWSRAIVGVFLLQAAVTAVITATLQHVVALWKRELEPRNRGRTSI